MGTQRIGRLDFDQPTLLAELKAIERFHYSHAYSDYLCGAPWRSCMLWAPGGDIGDGFITNYDKSLPVAQTAYARQLPHLAHTVERAFDLRHLLFARIAIVSPDSVIIPHKDLLELDKPLHRIHVPLITNEHSFFSHDNTVYRMRFGEAWFFDAGSMHSVASFADQDRVHLILDFAYVDDRDALVTIPRDAHAGIPPDSIHQRAALDDAQRQALLALADVIDADNYKDVFSIVIKKHFHSDGGDDFIWNTLLDISRAGASQAVADKIRDMHQYFMVAR
jgi:L-proline cis-4-hydroxylase